MKIQNIKTVNDKICTQISDELPDIVGPPDPFSKKRKRQESTESSYDPSASLFSDGHETSCVIKLNPPLKVLILLKLSVIQMMKLK